MRIFTLIAIAIVAATSGNVSAQRFVHRALPKAKAIHANKLQTAKLSERALPKKPKSATQLYMPLHEEVFFYENEWMQAGYIDYTYDNRGNVLTTDEENGRTEYTYDEENQWISQTGYTYDGNSDLQPYTRRTRVYDDIVKSLVVESMDYSWTGDAWELTNYQGYTWKRNVTRDDKLNVTGVSIDSYYEGEFQPMRRTTVTYNQDGLAETWKYEELTYDYGGQDFYWVEYYTLQDMQWYSTDGQVVAENIDEFFTGNNRLKSARVIEPDFGETGRIEAVYEENGNYSLTSYYYENLFGGAGREVYTLTYTDANGSTEETTKYYEDMNEDGIASDDELMESTKAITTYNEYGDLTAEEYYFDDIFDSGAKYDLEYGEYSYPAVMTVSQYDLDLDDYVPFIKVVRSNFVDVTTQASVTTVEAAPAESGMQSVYNLQGILLGSGTDNLPAGLYIVQKDGRTFKMLKK